MTTTTKIEFTTSAYFRSHGKTPSGGGSWAFQKATSITAFDSELVGEIYWVHGETFAAAKRALRTLGVSGLWAVLP